MRRQGNDEPTKTSFLIISVLLFKFLISWNDFLTSVFNFLAELTKMMH
ncbi:hypothetical protein IOR54_12760 [Staphylococcus saprophyticus]|nr:hypothetical protein [Staphylococcus saprophyticus]